MQEKLPDQIQTIDARLKTIEHRFSEMGYNMTSLVQSETKRRWKLPAQSETNFGLYTALCIDTIDPWKQNRVRFFNPLFHKPNSPIKALPFANAISAAGGFDDCGMNWVPPAGSTLCILFEHGSRSSPFYFGTTWHRDRGPDGQHIWGYNIDEYYQIHEGHRKGYLVGPNDGSQVFPPWNTENYNGLDIDSIADFENDPEAQRKITYPNIYGFKTPQKHMWKMVDGNYKCNHKDARLEVQSGGGGGYMIFKDDKLHENGWGHPDCGSSGPEIVCTDKDGNPVEKTDCEGGNTNSSIQRKASNPYFKQKGECRPIRGPGTPQGNKLALPQSGIQFLSGSGHTMIYDDSVEQPQGNPGWEAAEQPFSFGCNDKFTGKIKIISATGHSIELSDVEEDSQLRGENNYIRLLTASGNFLELNDHTVGQPNCPGSPPNVAGERRGITLRSTSNHSFEMIDNTNEQASPCRREGGTPTPKAKKAFVRTRTGYGLEIMMADDNTQDEQDSQYIQIFAPKDDDCGPHIMRFQIADPGYVFLRVGGNYICSTCMNHYTIVGDKEKHPSDKITMVSRNTVIDTEKFYVNIAEIHAFIAAEIILLMAGGDCKPKDWDGDLSKCGACVWPVLCLSPKGVTISDRVYVSASKDASCADITHLTPFHSCDPFDGC
jgi:hypothetical protein